MRMCVCVTSRWSANRYSRQQKYMRNQRDDNCFDVTFIELIVKTIRACIVG